MKLRRWERGLAAVLAALIGVMPVWAAQPEPETLPDAVYEEEGTWEKAVPYGEAELMEVTDTVTQPQTQAAVSANRTLHDYTNARRWPWPMSSYLDASGGQLVRVEALGEQVAVERYDMTAAGIAYRSGFSLDYELPLFGGYYGNEDYNFLIFGQTNLEEDDGKEVIRVVKYSKDWSMRLGAASLRGANTTTPFRAGSLRVSQSGDYLYIRTSHEMYRSSDGRIHQSNLTMEIDQETMEIVDQYSIVMNVGYGYVSHSFNQFISAETGVLAAVDHGDAYPRAVTLIRYQTPAGQRSFTGRCSYVPVLEMAGYTGQNDTGVMVGGFEVTSSAYLVAGVSVAQDENFQTNQAYNVFLTVTPTEDFSQVATRQIWLTDYQEGDEYCAANPQLVKLSDDRCLLLWEERTATNKWWDVEMTGRLSYVFVDGSGNPLGEIRTVTGSLSNCKPVVVNGTVLWYVTDGGKPVFHILSEEELDMLLTSDTETGALYGSTAVDSLLVRAVYDQQGRCSNVRVTPVKAGARADLEVPAESADTVKLFVLRQDTLAPLCRPWSNLR